MNPSVPLPDKKTGIHYALAPSGLELPVIDLGNPAFQVDDEALEAAARPERLRPPSFIRGLLMKPMLKRSRLAASIVGARGGALGGMATYLLKLGPDMLVGEYDNPADRMVASSLPCLSARKRLERAAWLECQAAEAALSARGLGARLILINLAGGPSSDSLNALILLRRRSPGLLEGVPIRLLVLDRDEEGPEFALRSLAALKAEGGPLAGLDAEASRSGWDWDDDGSLAEALGTLDAGRDAVVLSSEGGLFEYASDGRIAAALGVARRLTPPDAAFVGTVSAASGAAGAVNSAMGTAARVRSFDSFVELARRSGWEPAARLDCPLSVVFSLRPA